MASLSLSQTQCGLLSGYSAGIVYAMLAHPIAFVVDYWLGALFAMIALLLPPGYWCCGVGLLLSILLMKRDLENDFVTGR